MMVGERREAIDLHRGIRHVYIHIARAHRPCLVMFVVNATSLSKATFMMSASAHTRPITNTDDATGRVAPCTMT